MSFFRDSETGAFLDSFDSSLIGQRVAVRANILAGGSMRFAANGSSPRFICQSRAGETAPNGFNLADPQRPLGRVQWNATSHKMILRTDHSFQVPVQPQFEARSIFADRAGFFDAGLSRLPAQLTTSTTTTPWLRWMGMGDIPGHLVWHCSDEKFFDVAALPADYRAHAGGRIENLTNPPAY